MLRVKRESRAMRIPRKITIFSPPLATTILVRPMTFDSVWLKIFAVFTSCIVRLCTLLSFQPKSLHSYCFRKLYKQETHNDCQKVFISFIQKLNLRVKRNLFQVSSFQKWDKINETWAKICIHISLRWLCFGWCVYPSGSEYTNKTVTWPLTSVWIHILIVRFLSQMVTRQHRLWFSILNTDSLM